MKIPIKCNVCNYEWSPDVCVHIKGHGCPNCAGNAPYTLIKFLNEAKPIHSNNINFDNIEESDIKGYKSLIKLECNLCHNKWTNKLCNIIRGYGCPRCSDNTKYTLDKFLFKCQKYHGDKYDYSRITDIKSIWIQQVK